MDAMPDVDTELREALQEARWRPCNFVLTGRGGRVARLIVHRLRIKAEDVVKAQKECPRTEVVQGVVAGHGRDLDFRVRKEPALRAEKLKNFILDQTKLAVNACFTPPAAAQAKQPLAALFTAEDYKEEFRGIGQVGVDIRPRDVRQGKPAGDMPPNVAPEVLSRQIQTGGRDCARDWPCLCVHWEASGLCHQPLYFEETNLERYYIQCKLSKDTQDSSFSAAEPASGRQNRPIQ